MKYNKICIVCGGQYYYCNQCKEHMYYPTWMNVYHSENCKDIYNIVSGYLSNRTSKDEALSLLSKCDLSYKEKLHNKIREAIDIIFEPEKTEVPVKIKPRYSKKNKLEKIDDSAEPEEVFEQ